MYLANNPLVSQLLGIFFVGMGIFALVRWCVYKVAGVIYWPFGLLRAGYSKAYEYIVGTFSSLFRFVVDCFSSAILKLAAWATSPVLLGLFPTIISGTYFLASGLPITNGDESFVGIPYQEPPVDRDVQTEPFS